MKEIIYIYLISSVFGVSFLPKHKSIRVKNETGIVYMNADEFGKNNYIHIEIKVHNNDFNNRIYFDFIDEEPNDSCEPTRLKDPDSSASTFSESYSDDGGYSQSYTYKYYYDIKKDIQKKYFIIKYSGNCQDLKDGYTEIENTIISWNIFFKFLIYGSIALFILLVLCCCFYKKIKKCIFIKGVIKKREEKASSEIPLAKTNNHDNNAETPGPQDEDPYSENPNKAIDTNY